MGALPVADEATWASGRGLYATQAHRRQGAHRAPQQGDDLPRAIDNRPYKRAPTFTGVGADIIRPPNVS